MTYISKPISSNPQILLKPITVNYRQKSLILVSYIFIIKQSCRVIRQLCVSIFHYVISVSLYSWGIIYYLYTLLIRFITRDVIIFSGALSIINKIFITTIRFTTYINDYGVILCFLFLSFIADIAVFFRIIISFNWEFHCNK